MARLGLGSTLADDACQRLREKLLIGRNGSPGRIADYAGRGPLGGWIRVAAVREALSLQRLQRTPAEDEQLEQVAVTGADVELDYIKVRSCEAFSEAFHRALAELPAKDRIVIRLHYVERLNIEAIGKLRGVHRATVARWLILSREALLAGTRRHLRQIRGLRPAEIDSLWRFVASRIQVDLRFVEEGGRDRDQP